MEPGTGQGRPRERFQVEGVRGVLVRGGVAGGPGGGGPAQASSVSPAEQLQPAVGAGAHPEPWEEIKRISCQRVLPFYGFWPCPLVLTQPPSGSLRCGPAPAGAGPSRGGGCLLCKPGVWGSSMWHARLEFLRSWDQLPGWPLSAPARARPRFPSPRGGPWAPTSRLSPGGAQLSELSLGDAECHLWACGLLEAHPASHFMG